ncbi:FAD:protein FMN transferase [Pseudohaliea rubra]|uniref:FAD:protein FMN transferase n=1 Tax=Pseudohaliea rubra DSM 19751 TaxID=1265313 RepID=A0A095VPG4_9GAMM|nr:FAD:protein FMN transferase [Pseudohaliea rubra]KGE03362.1 Thiamin biosynthesis lipoprotein ApbE [Pseudohaliea rubra DSM 19751]
MAFRRAQPARRRANAVYLAALLTLLAACSSEPRDLRLEGRTMGTSWHVTVPGGAAAESALTAGIESELEAINDSMSTWREDSEISRFNRLPPGEAMTISPRFAAVLAGALAIGDASAGAYDVTVGPLVDLWGFGPDGPGKGIPAAASLAETRARVGQKKLDWDPEARRLAKRGPVALDFSSIAKGYAVDRVAELLAGRGFADYLVEIGGEMRVAGRSPRGDAWRVAVERPEAGGRSIARGLALFDAGIATSGDYRNFFTVNGVRYSHMIDPRTGTPVTHDVVSVTVIHESCMLADGWATALAVLGREAALRVATEAGLAVYLLARQGEGFREYNTPAFAPYLADETGQG